MNNLSIIIPAYNEEKRIGKTLKLYSEYFNKQYPNYEILVVINGCTDNTKKIVKSLFSKRIKYIDIGKVNDKGEAVIAGFNYVNTELIGFVDADASTPPEAFYDLVKQIGNNDCIIASRWIKGSKVFPKQPIIRIIASRVFNLLVRFLFGLKLHDTQCGAKLFKKKAIKSIISELNITRWAFDVNLLYLIKRNGYKLTEIPTIWKDDPNSTLNIKKASFEMFLALVRLRMIYSPFKPLIQLYNKIPEPLKIHHGWR